MTNKALETAPPLPNGCVDFNKLHEAAKKGDADAVEKALVVPSHETARHQTGLLSEAEKTADAAPQAARHTHAPNGD